MSVIQFADTFSHSLGFLFVFFMFYSTLLLYKSLYVCLGSFVYFVFISIALGDWPKKTLVQFMSENVLPVISSGCLMVYESESEVTQSCPTPCDPMDCSLPGSSTHGIFQARILEWGAISFSRRSSQPRDWTWISCIVGRCFTVWATNGYH